MDRFLGLFSAFVDSSDRDAFLAVRQQLLSSEHFDPNSDKFELIEELVVDNRFDDAAEQLGQAMPNLILSPRAHLLSALVARKRGDSQSEQTAFKIAAACCQGIISTGEGNRDAPYIVTRTSDEYDVLQFLDKEFKRQTLKLDGQRRFDVMESTDGLEFWFDITEAVIQACREQDG